MKKWISFVAGMILGCTLVVGFTTNADAGGWQFFDLNWRFEQAKINLLNEVIDVEVKSWKDYDDSDVVQITAEDGSVYLTHYTNVVLIHKP